MLIWDWQRHSGGACPREDVNRKARAENFKQQAAVGCCYYVTMCSERCQPVKINCSLTSPPHNGLCYARAKSKLAICWKCMGRRRQMGTELVLPAWVVVCVYDRYMGTMRTWKHTGWNWNAHDCYLYFNFTIWLTDSLPGERPPVRASAGPRPFKMKLWNQLTYLPDTGCSAPSVIAQNLLQRSLLPRCKKQKTDYFRFLRIKNDRAIKFDTFFY